MKINEETQKQWKKKIIEFVDSYDSTLDDIKSPSLAWQIADRLGIPREAYQMDESICDVHIETALKRIFTSVVW